MGIRTVSRVLALAVCLALGACTTPGDWCFFAHYCPGPIPGDPSKVLHSI